MQIAEGVYTIFPNRTSTSMAYDVGLVRSTLTDAGLDEVELLKGRMHIPLDRCPGVALRVEIPPISHPCDLVADRTRGAAPG